GLAARLPPRHDRAVPWPPCGGAHLVPQGNRPEPAVLHPLEPAGSEGSPVVKRIAVAAALIASVAVLVAPSLAAAHPLGDFTINRSAAVYLSGNRLYVSYVLDLAEVPTFQDKQSGVGAGDYLRRIERGLHVTVAGKPITLQPIARRLAHPNGQGGLK